MAGPALGVLELSSIARGVVVADAVIKRAEAPLIASRPVSGGKHLVILAGEVAEVGESMVAGRQAAGELLIDSLELPLLDPQWWPLFPEPVTGTDWAGDEGAESVAVVETTTVCACIEAGDRALKTAPVTLRDVRLAVGISGKAFFTMTGRLADIEAAAEAARAAAGPRLVALEVVSSPAGELRGRLIF
jgi:microcompartment protein CcmL/EutN